MVAHVMVDPSQDEYDILELFGMIRTPKEARGRVQKELPANFKKLRAR